MLSDCSECRVSFYCSQSETECQSYHEAYGLANFSESSACTRCINYGYCTGSDEDCSSFYGNKTLDDTTMRANRGLVNWVSGPIISVVSGDYTSLISIRAGGQMMTSMMPRRDFESLGYKAGDVITMAIKSLNVKILR